MKAYTIILLNYMRPYNMPAVISAITSQKAKGNLVVCDNSPDQQSRWPTAKVIRAPWNAGTFMKILCSFFAETPWIIHMDDDLLPTDQDVFSDAIALAEKNPRGMTGLCGAEISSVPPYYGEDAYGSVALLKGRFVVFRKELLDSIRFMRSALHDKPEYRMRVEDLYLSLEIGKGEKVHWADRELYTRFRNLQQGPHALEAHPDHVKIRSSFIADYLALDGRKP